jgi:hypothetical protein
VMRASDRDRERAVALLRARGAGRLRRARVTPGDELVLGDCPVVLEPADG